MQATVSTMSRLCGAITVAMVLAAPVWAQDDKAVAGARAAAQQWLAQIDAGDYAASWRDGAAPFRAAVSQQQWQGAMQQMRGALGAAAGRTLTSATFTRSMPGQPEGQYVVIQYTTQFANKPQAVETVTPMREQDGSWRVSGYYVQ